MKKVKSYQADVLGISTSTICVIHCSILPLLVGFGIFESISWMHSIEIELLLLFLTILFAGYSLIPGFFRNHKNKSPILVALLGIFTFCIGLVYHETLGLWLCSLGGILLAISHFLNYKLSHIH